MKISKKRLNQISAFALIISLGVVLGLIVNLLIARDSNFSNSSVKNIDGIQTITLKAGLGYSPNRIMASASVPTVLEINTNNTYDCTAFLNIPALNIKKFLPPTGITKIEIEPRKAGDVLEGFCGSDTYKFVIRFS